MTLTLENIVVQFDHSVILEGVSFEVAPGEIVGLIGQNGCGKTTLLNTISGFVPQQAGSIVFQDEDITRWSPSQRARKGLGRSFQTPGVFREMTVEENVMIALENAEKYPWWWRFSKTHRHRSDRRIQDALESVGLEGHKHSLAGVLSGGQLRLLELLRLEISGGKLLLVDEPTAGVSPVMKQVLAKTLKKLAREKERSMILVEHDLKFLFELVDQVIVLVEGKVYMQGTPEEVIKDPKLKEVYFGTTSR